MRAGDRDAQGETWDRLTTGPSRGAGAQHLISGSRPENKHPLFQYPLPPGSGRCDGGSRNRYLACGGGMLCLLKPRTVTGCFPSRHNPHSSWGGNQEPSTLTCYGYLSPHPLPPGISGLRKKPQCCGDHGYWLQATPIPPPDLSVAI